METFEMTLKKYADFVQSETRSMVEHSITPLEVEILALSNALGGEVGELQNVVKKIISKNVLLKQSELHEKFLLEAGDVLWYLVRLILKNGFLLENVMQLNISKLTKKYTKGDTWRK